MQDSASKFAQAAAQLRDIKQKSVTEQPEDMSKFIKDISESIGEQIVLARECFTALLEKCKGDQNLFINNILTILLEYKIKQTNVKNAVADPSVLFQDMEKGEMMLDVIKHMAGPVDRFKKFTRELIKILESDIEDKKKEQKIALAIIGYEF